MKKLFIVGLMVCASAYSAKAQISKGSAVVGGGFSIQKSETEYADEEIEESTTSFGPSVGFFVADGIAIGLNVGFSNTEASEIENYDGDVYEYKLETSGLSAGPFVRFYKSTSNEHFAFFGQVSLNFGKIESEYSVEDFGSTTERTDKITQFAFSPGFAYFFNQTWSAELAFKGLSYSSTKGKYKGRDEESKTTEIEFGLDSLTPTIGIRVYFAK